MKHIAQIEHVLENSNVITHPYAYHEQAFVMEFQTALIMMTAFSVVYLPVPYTAPAYYTVYPV